MSKVNTGNKSEHEIFYYTNSVFIIIFLFYYFLETVPMRIIDHDHSYGETQEKLKKDLMLAMAKIDQLTAKNRTLLKKDKRNKQRIASMIQVINQLSKKNVPCS